MATLIITALVGIGVTAVLTVTVVRLIMHQIKLYHSINLVELRTSKLPYFVFAIVVGFLMFYIILLMADERTPGADAICKIYGVDRTHANVAYMFAFVMTFAVEALLLTLGFSRTAVVDKGVYTNFGMLDWHQVRDYVIDEERCVLVLSSDKRTFSTLKNVTTPFRVVRGDIPKIKFILNKNKNKFSGFESE